MASSNIQFSQKKFIFFPCGHKLFPLNQKRKRKKWILRNGPFSGAMLEVIGCCYEPILGNGHFFLIERWTNFTSFFLFTIEQFCVCLQWGYMNKAYGGFYVASIFHVKYIFHFVLSFSLGLSFKFPLQFLICLAPHFISCYQVLLPIPLFMGLFHLRSHGLVYIYFFLLEKKRVEGATWVGIFHLGDTIQ